MQCRADTINIIHAMQQIKWIKHKTMIVNMEILSKELIKPSSPTPNHLKTYKISLLDQFAGSYFVPMLLFYTANSHFSISNRSQLLKQALSRTLPRYYPLAGRATDSLTIDCNDDGAYYISATVDSTLYELLKIPDHSVFPKFIPEEKCFNMFQIGDPLVMVQETRFSCGGMAIGVAISHMICDAAAISFFVKTWAAIARDIFNGEETKIVFPDYSKTSQFLQSERLFQYLKGRAMVFNKMKGKSVMRRFVFDGLVMPNLKSITQSSNVPNPTRVEVVLAVLFRSIMSAMKSSMVVSLAVSLRRKAMPPMDESCVGNFVWITQVALDPNETDLSCLVRRIREAVYAINDDLVKSFQGEQGVDMMILDLKQGDDLYPKFGTHTLLSNSWVNLGLYESADFAWGKPVWIPCATITDDPPCPCLQLMDANKYANGGIEAWLMLEEQVMELVENDKQLLSFAALNPTPLQVHD